jgi:hypothetical protein
MSPRADREHVDEAPQPVFEAVSGPGRSLDRNLQAAGTMPVGTVEVDGHDRAAAAA